MTGDFDTEFWSSLDGFGGADKHVSLGQAIRTHVELRDTIHIAYSDARPNAAMLELVRQFADKDPRFTIVTAGLVSTQHALVASGIVERVITSFAGENFPAARPNKAFQRAVATGRIELENWSLWSLVARLMAGALGVSHMPVRSLAGSGMASQHEGKAYSQIRNPFSPDQSIGVVAALRPDVVLLQGVAADVAGNVIASAPFGEGLWGAMAAHKGVIACVERIVDTETIRRANTAVRIPAHRVLAVCEVPYGSHPYGLYSDGFPAVDSYVEDEQFIREVFVASQHEGTFKEWIDEWVLGTVDHAAYLEKLGRHRLHELENRADPDAWKSDAKKLTDEDASWSGSEAMVTVAARRIINRVGEVNHDAVLAGVGQANLASWAAVWQLKQSAVDVELMAEIGMFGYLPRPGEPFIFAKRNLPTSTMLTDVMTILGTFVSGPGTSTLGVIGAAQLDEDGNANSTYDDHGTFLVGSGGANDIASAADELLVIVQHDRRRLVSKVPYVTCPGHNLKTVVTSLGVFERRDNRMSLTSYLPAAGADAQAAIERIRAGCDWDFDVADHLVAELPPTLEELRLIRSFDPARMLLQDRKSQEAVER